MDTSYEYDCTSKNVQLKQARQEGGVGDDTTRARNFDI